MPLITVYEARADFGGARVCDPQHVAGKTKLEKTSTIHLEWACCGSPGRAPEQ